MLCKCVFVPSIDSVRLQGVFWSCLFMFTTLLLGMLWHQLSQTVRGAQNQDSISEHVVHSATGICWRHTREKESRTNGIAARKMPNDVKQSENKRESITVKIENGNEKESAHEEKREKSFVELRKMLEDDSHLKHLKCDDAYLDRFLAIVNYNADEAFKRIQQFYEVLEENPTWFTKETPDDKKWLIEKNIRIALKHRDKEGRPIYVIKLATMDPSTMDFVNDITAVDDFFMEAMFTQNLGLENGLCVIIDVANFSYKLTKWATPSNIKTAVKRMYTMPIKDFRYHVVNSSLWVNIIIKLIWPFLPQHVKEQVKFHFNDFEALHQDIDKDVLPEEYQGTQKINPSELNLFVLDNSSEIVNNLRLSRDVYLENVNSNKVSTK